MSQFRQSGAWLAARKEKKNLPSAFCIEQPKKYRNVRTLVDGIAFDSKREAKCWGELKLREHAGEISHLQRGPTFPLMVNNVVIQRYKADFWYREKGCVIVADAKSAYTAKMQAWRRTKLLMLTCYGIDVQEL